LALLYFHECFQVCRQGLFVQRLFEIMVEAVGVEPTSEETTIVTSTSVV